MYTYFAHQKKETRVVCNLFRKVGKPDIFSRLAEVQEFGVCHGEPVIGMLACQAIQEVIEVGTKEIRLDVKMNKPFVTGQVEAGGISSALHT